MIVVIDNYDSFTYNLVDYIGQQTSEEICVFRHDQVTISELQDLGPSRIVISPGPKTPLEAGISNDVVRQFGPKTPLLGVCLGHQCIGHVFGGKIIQAKQLMHGKVSKVQFEAHLLFDQLPNPFEATRYHSLVIDPKTVPDCLKVIARSVDDDEIMAVVHETYPIYGVQFHPESICTPEGLKLVGNFLLV